MLHLLFASLLLVLSLLAVVAWASWRDAVHRAAMTPEQRAACDEEYRIMLEDWDK